MIAAQVPASAGASARLPGGAGEATSNSGGDGDFANLLAGPAAAPAGKPAATTATGTESDNQHSDTAETPHEPLLPEQLLALLVNSPLAPTTAGSTPTAALAPGIGTSPLSGFPGAAAVLPATTTALAAATATALAATTAGASATAVDPASASLPLAAKPDTGLATAAFPLDTAALPLATAEPGAVQNNTQAIAVDDFAKALGLATGEVGADPGTAPELGDRSSLLAPTASATATPARVNAAALAAPLALPADPDAGFDDGFGARIGWLADQRIGRAEIRLNPEHLGAIDVRLQIDGSKVSAEFQSAHADVRHVLESSVGRLREMLGQQGLQLTHADVGQGRGGEQGERAATARGGDLQSEPDAGLGDLQDPRPTLSRGLLDEYA